jgi:phosphotransferase system  glucose/maltose/N-acetylglucosamine-specific IIC component
MKESQFWFDYSWEDARPIRPLVVTMVISQIAGAVIGLILAPVSFWVTNLCIGAASATFIGYLIGLIVQYITNANNLRDHRIMVRRLGLISLFLCAIALFFLIANRRLY